METDTLFQIKNAFCYTLFQTLAEIQEVNTMETDTRTGTAPVPGTVAVETETPTRAQGPITKVVPAAERTVTEPNASRIRSGIKELLYIYELSQQF